MRYIYEYIYEIRSCHSVPVKVVSSREQLHPTGCKLKADKDLRKQSAQLLQEVLVLDGCGYFL